MSSILILNKPQVVVGLNTMTYTVGPAGLYNVQVSTTVPNAIATGDGAGSGQGPGSGAGGGDPVGFNAGGLAIGNGGKGQGFGAVPNNYNQPSLYGSNQTSGPTVSSSLSIVVNQNGSPIYTMPTIAPTQGEMRFKIPIVAAASDAITVVISSSNPYDQQLNSVKSTVSIGEGL